jgi:hypothetical protein
VRSPSRHPAVQAEGVVIVGQAPLFDVRFGDRSQHLDPLAAQRRRGGDMVGVREGLMPAPDTFVVSDWVAWQSTRTRCRSAMTSMRRPITPGCTE